MPTIVPALRRCFVSGLALLLAACVSPAERIQRAEVWQCADKTAPDCEPARVGFQQVTYNILTPDRLAVAAARALGDLNFEVERDDEHRQASGAYIDSAPVHDKQLDALFRGTLKPYRPAAITARVEVLPLAQGDNGGAVRLRLFASSGAEPVQVDSVGPYQVFFRQLGEELGAPAEPVEDPKDPRDRHKDRPQPLSPSLGGV